MRFCIDELIGKARDSGTRVFLKPNGRLYVDPGQFRFELMSRRAEAEVYLQSIGEVEPDIFEEEPRRKFQPFPVDVLPGPFRSIVTEGAVSTGADPSFIALPLLAVVGSVIGNSRRIEIKRGWTEPPILWCSIVGDSGSLKSPSLDLALKPMRRMQAEAFEAYQLLQESYDREFEEYQRDLAVWKRGKGGNAPEKPVPPILRRLIGDDVTIEGLAAILSENPRGVLIAKDELAGWFGGFDKYSRGKSDQAAWLSLFGGRSVMIDRKTGRSSICIPHGSVNVCGGIQPGIVRKCLGQRERDSGLAARLLWAYPPRVKKRWTEDEVRQSVEEGYEQAIRRLHSLEMDHSHERPQPVSLKLTAEAKQEWIRFYNEHAHEQYQLDGDAAASWSKLEGYAARLALIHHCMLWASGTSQAGPLDPVGVASIRAGVSLSRWFGQETLRMMDMLGEDGETQTLRTLEEAIGRMGGSATPRDLMRSSRRWGRTASEVETKLNQLAANGVGDWDVLPSGSSGGAPTRIFRLSTDTTPENTEDSEVLSTVGSVDTTNYESTEDVI